MRYWSASLIYERHQGCLPVLERASMGLGFTESTAQIAGNRRRTVRAFLHKSAASEAAVNRQRYARYHGCSVTKQKDDRRGYLVFRSPAPERHLLKIRFPTSGRPQ